MSLGTWLKSVLSPEGRHKISLSFASGAGGNCRHLLQILVFAVSLFVVLFDKLAVASGKLVFEGIVSGVTVAIS